MALKILSLSLMFVSKAEYIKKILEKKQTSKLNKTIVLL